MSWFSSVKQVPPIEPFALTKQFTEDDFPRKVNVSIGAFRDDDGQPWVLPVVRATERVLANDKELNKEYLPVLGMESFSTLATKLLLGNDSLALAEKRAFGIQCVSGSGALVVGAEFLAKQLGRTIFYVSKPFYEHHELIFLNAGFKEIRKHRYWDVTTRSLDIDGFLEDLNNAPEGSVIVLQVCAHNPVGCDPSQKQWEQIAHVIKKRKLFPFFDSAYQGFASGDLDQDAWVLRYFVSQGFELFCAQALSKNMGIYNERAGNLAVVMSNPDEIPAVKSQLTLIIRGMYSNPPSHGARIALYILSNKELFEQWKVDIRTMASRVIKTRKLLRNELERIGVPGSWNHITDQIGMFSYTGLSSAQSERMVEKHHVYMLRCGRINMCGINENNVEYVAKSMHEVLTSLPTK